MPTRPARWRRWLAHHSSPVEQWVRLVAALVVVFLALALAAPPFLKRGVDELAGALGQAAEAARSALEFRPPIGFLVVLLLALGLALGRALRRPVTSLRSALQFLLDHLVQLLALVLLVPLLVLFFRAALVVPGAPVTRSDRPPATAAAPKPSAGPDVKPDLNKPDIKEVAALAVLVLVVALFVGSGPLILARLKKLGPLELFEKEAPGLYDRLKELMESGHPDIEQAQAAPFSPASVLVAKRADLLISLVEFLGPKELTRPAKRDLARLLFQVGTFAVRRQEWPTARARLEWLRKLLGEDYDRDRHEIIHDLPYKLPYNLGKAYLHEALYTKANPDPALSGPETARRLNELLNQSLDCFALAAEEKPYSRRALFNRAYVEDELGMFRKATETNREVLELFPTDAAAKYNSAISLINLGELADATAILVAITLEDFRGAEMLELALTDPDLDPLSRDPGSRARVISWLIENLGWWPATQRFW